MHKAERMKQIVLDINERFVESAKGRVGLKCTIITGSFAAWLRDKSARPSFYGVPDLNYYPLIEGPEGAVVVAADLLKRSITSTLDSHAPHVRNVNLVLDLHPFTITPNKVLCDARVFNLQLTTRIINAAEPDRHPGYCWSGWLENNVPLYVSDEGYLQSLEHLRRSERDQIWLRNMYLALVSYGNVLHMVPLYTSDREHAFDEAFRYLKEIMKDGITLALTSEEFYARANYALFKNWRTGIGAFYLERYGKDAEKIVSRILEIEADYFRVRDGADPLEVIRDALALRLLVLERGFMARVSELSHDGAISVDAFRVLPYWW